MNDRSLATSKDAVPGASIIAVRAPEPIDLARRLPLKSSEPVQIFVTLRAQQEMLQHALEGCEGAAEAGSGAAYEVKGFLYGTVARWSASRYVVEIRDLIRLRRRDDDRDDATFVRAMDHDYAQRVAREQASRFGGLTLVGFYHSHPNHEVSLSGFDLHLLDGLFPAFYHVAVVVQPRERRIGYFIRRKGKHSVSPAAVVALPSNEHRVGGARRSGGGLGGVKAAAAIAVTILVACGIAGLLVSVGPHPTAEFVADDRGALFSSRQPQNMSLPALPMPAQQLDQPGRNLMPPTTAETPSPTMKPGDEAPKANKSKTKARKPGKPTKRQEASKKTPSG